MIRALKFSPLKSNMVLYSSGGPPQGGSREVSDPFVGY